MTDPLYKHIARETADLSNKLAWREIHRALTACGVPFGDGHEGAHRAVWDR